MKRTISLLVLTLWGTAALSQNAVVTYHYDNARTGQNTHERILTPANVKAPDQFVRLFTHQVEGDVYAQPLYVPKLEIPRKGRHNVVFVATEADQVYAFDAENSVGRNANYLWKADLLDPKYGATAGATTVCADSTSHTKVNCAGIVNCDDTQPQYGITSTPVIDLERKVMYVVALSQEGANAIYRLHVLDIATGKERSRPHLGHKEIAGTVNGIKFDPSIQHNRPGLLHANGKIYIGFGSHCDQPAGVYHGWIFAYNAETLKQEGVFVATPNGYRAGIWMEGTGLAADEHGQLFVVTANGTFTPTPNATNGLQDFGDSILKLDRKLDVPPKDYFTPYNQDLMDSEGPTLGFDVDLGSGGVVLLPEQPGNHPHLLVQAGKGGTLYLVDRDNMGHFCSGCTSDTNIVQELVNGVGATTVPAYWNKTVYARGDGQVLNAFPLSNGLLGPALHQTTDTYSGRVVVSADGDKNGIVWTLDTDAADPFNPGPAILNAYDAIDLSLLYSSAANQTRDNPGNAIAFSTPIEADGRVYVGAVGQLSVFGLYTVRIEIKDLHLAGGKWCATVTAVDSTTGQPVAGTVNINRTTGSTNEPLCFPPCSSRRKGSDSAMDREPSPCKGTVSIPGLPPRLIHVWPL